MNQDMVFDKIQHCIGQHKCTVSVTQNRFGDPCTSGKIDSNAVPAVNKFSAIFVCSGGKTHITCFFVGLIDYELGKMIDI